jgi:hypothetical protein
MVLPCKTSVEVQSEVSDRLYLRYDCLVDVVRGAMSSPEGECGISSRVKKYKKGKKDFSNLEHGTR